MSPETMTPPAVRRRIGVATSIHVCPERWRAFFWRRRMTLSSIGGLIDRSDAFGSAVCAKKRAGLFALDDLATALNMNLEDLIYEIASDLERDRISIL